MKEGLIDSTRTAVTQNELKQINRFSRKPLTDQELYTFNVVLCDNEIDRDGEQFDPGALKEMAGLFIGKTGIFDHSMKGSDQKARIFSAQMEQVQGKTNRVGEPYCRLTAKAYMLRARENETLIGEIDAGIKKEVSVGVSVEQAVCSVCGVDSKKGRCSHQPGRLYGGKSCYRILKGVQDAYEWSFVAVPAQPNAGVIKAFQPDQGGKKVDNMLEILKNGSDTMTVTKAQREELLKSIRALEEEAELGRVYKKTMRSDLIRLLPLVMPEMDIGVFGRVAEVMTWEELKSFQSAFEARKNKMIPGTPQLAVTNEQKPQSFDQFKI